MTLCLRLSSFWESQTPRNTSLLCIWNRESIFRLWESSSIFEWAFLWSAFIRVLRAWHFIILKISVLFQTWNNNILKEVLQNLQIYYFCGTMIWGLAMWTWSHQVRGTFPKITLRDNWVELCLYQMSFCNFLKNNTKCACAVTEGTRPQAHIFWNSLEGYGYYQTAVSWIWKLLVQLCYFVEGEQTSGTSSKREM